jgi:hypothetical protein
MLEFLGRMTHFLALCPVEHNCNMPVYNWVLHRFYNDRIYTGFPWNRCA